MYCSNASTARISSISYEFDHEVFFHWDLSLKESPESSERSLLKSLEQFSTWKRRVYTSRLFKILCNNGSLCLPNIIRLRYFQILETGHMFTFFIFIFVALILSIIWEVITDNWVQSRIKMGWRKRLMNTWELHSIFVYLNQFYGLDTA